MCLYPKIIKNPKYKENSKNKGIVKAPKNIKQLGIPVGCGKCIECRARKGRDWKIRLLEEVRERKNGKFVTFSFNDEGLKHYENKCKGLKGYELDNAVASVAIRRFTENWRKKYKKSPRHWFVTELGERGTERIHIHGIIWTNRSEEEIADRWRFSKQNSHASQSVGFVYVGEYVNDRTVGYIVKYLHKADIKHKEYVPKVFASKGIGSGYFRRSDWQRNIYNGRKTNETYRDRKGYKMALPIYYRNKLYTEDQRENLWAYKIEEDTRYVMGKKIVNESSKEGKRIYRGAREEASEARAAG